MHNPARALSDGRGLVVGPGVVCAWTSEQERAVPGDVGACRTRAGVRSASWGWWVPGVVCAWTSAHAELRQGASTGCGLVAVSGSFVYGWTVTHAEPVCGAVG